MKDFAGKLIGCGLLTGIVFGLFAVVVAPIEMFKKAEAEAWPARKGTITVSYARHYRGGFGKNPSGPYWKAEICGRYDDGEKFCVSRIRYGGFRFGAGKASALETVAKYPVGRKVNIYYSPKNPKETVLEKQSSWNEMFILLGLGISFLLLPVFLWLFRKRIEPKRYGRT